MTNVAKSSAVNTKYQYIFFRGLVAEKKDEDLFFVDTAQKSLKNGNNTSFKRICSVY